MQYEVIQITLLRIKFAATMQEICMNKKELMQQEWTLLVKYNVVSARF